MDDDRPIRVATVSLGCPKNLIDSERMLAELAQAGCLVGAPAHEADVLLINTCAFLESARAEAVEALREALDLKEQGPCRRIVVAGCLATRNGLGLFDLTDGIDAIVGLNDREAIVEAVTGQARVARLSGRPGPHPLSDRVRYRLTPEHTAYLRIAEGCSRGCTFCTIPAIRGPFRSKRPQDVLDEARELVADGAKELNLIAQDTTAYGEDLPGRIDLAGLLTQLNDLNDVEWIRLLYAYPRRFDDRLIEALAGLDRVVPYLDMPLQHINDDVLRRMGRGVSRREIEAVLDKLCTIEGMTVRTTFIVGFPGETDADFRELRDFVREGRFDSMGVFEFSPEPGTPAFEMPDPVDDETTSARAEELMATQALVVRSKQQAMFGRTVRVLVDGVDEEGTSFGRTVAQAPDIDGVCLLTEPVEAGRFLSCTVENWDEYDLIVRPSP